MNTKKTLFSFLKYCSFSMLSMIGTSCYVLADTLFIANGVGSLGLTALNLVLPIFNIIFGIGILIGIGAATRFSILKSQKHHHEANQYFTQAIIVGSLISLPIMFIGILLPDSVMNLLGANSDILQISIDYLRTFVVFTPFFIINQILVAFIRNDHNPRLASIAMIIGTAFNIIFDYILVFPCQLGMVGAALATGISPIVTILVCLLHFIQKKNQFCFVKTKLSLSHIYHFITIGIPSFITELSSGIIIFIFNMIILNIGGNIAIASYGIVCNLAIVVTSLFVGIGQGIQPLLSQCHGQRDAHKIHIYLKYALILSTSIFIFIYCTIFICPQFIISLFNNENNMMMSQIAKEGLLIYFTGFFFAGINIVETAYFAAIEKVKPSIMISLLRSGVIIIPLVLILSKLFSLTGVWLSFPISESLVFFIVFMFHKKYQLTYDHAYI